MTAATATMAPPNLPADTAVAAPSWLDVVWDGTDPDALDVALLVTADPGLPVTTVFWVCAVPLALAVFTAPPEMVGTEMDGMEMDGMETDGMETDGMETAGMETDGIETAGMEGIDTAGMEGMLMDGMSRVGMPVNIGASTSATLVGSVDGPLTWFMVMSWFVPLKKATFVWARARVPLRINVRVRAFILYPRLVSGIRY